MTGEPETLKPNTRRIWWSLALAFGLIVFVRVVLWLELLGTPLGSWEEWPETDMAIYLAQARWISTGDWLARDLPLPQTGILRTIDIAALEATRPAGQFYQAPAYPYLLAVLGNGTILSVALMRLMQMLAGLLATVLSVSIASKLAEAHAPGERPERAACAVRAAFAALLLASFAPALLSGQQLLRESWVWLLGALSLAWIAMAADPHMMRPSLIRWRWAMLGVLTGAGLMLHEAAWLVPVALLGAVVCGRLRIGREHAAGFLASVLFGYLPLLLRNALVGAPLGPSYFGSLMTFIWANHAANPTGGISYQPPGPWLIDALAAAQGSAWGALRAVIASHGGGIGGTFVWLGGVAWRALHLALPFDAPQNDSLAFYRLHSRVLAIAPGFEVLMPLASVGVATLLARLLCRRSPESDSSAVALGWAVLAWLVGGVALLSLNFPVGRFRMILLPALLPLAGFGAAWLWESRRSPRQFLSGLTLALCVVGGQFWLASVTPLTPLRSVDFVIATRGWLQRGELDQAIAELELARRHGIASPELDQLAALIANPPTQ